MQTASTKTARKQTRKTTHSIFLRKLAHKVSVTEGFARYERQEICRSDVGSLKYRATRLCFVRLFRIVFAHGAQF
jgi:hypothetical protein